MNPTRIRKRLWWISTVLVVLLSARYTVAQQTYTWALPGAGSWHNPNNWEPNTGIPLFPDTAIVNQGTVLIRSATPAVCQELQLASVAGSAARVEMDATGASLLISPGGTVFVGMATDGCGTFTQTGGVVKGDEWPTTISIGYEPGATGVYHLSQGGRVGNKSPTLQLAPVVAGCGGKGLHGESGGL